MPPITFTEPQTVLQNYNYTDIQGGTGLISYNLFATRDTVGYSYLISDKVYYGYPVLATISISTASDTYASMGSIDFDMPAFNTPKIVKGTGFLTFTFGSSRNTGTHIQDVYFVITIKKNSGGVYTTIGTATSHSVGDNSNDGVFTIDLSVMKVNFTQTKFKIGDNIRINVDCWARSQGGGAITGGGACSILPQNIAFTGFNDPATSDYANTFTVQIPYKIFI